MAAVLILRRVPHQTIGRRDKAPTVKWMILSLDGTMEDTMDDTMDDTIIGWYYGRYYG